jgi:hypothetical protein
MESRKRMLLLSADEAQEWLESGLTGEEIREKIRSKITETEELEGPYSDNPEAKPDLPPERRGH